MTHGRIFLLSLALVLLATRSEAQWSVIDGAANIKLWGQYLLQLEEYKKQVEMVFNQYTQIQNQIRQIQYASDTVQHGIRNLQRFDVSNATSLMGLYRELSGKLNDLKWMGYQMGAIETQMQSLYGEVQMVYDGRTLQRMKRQWSQAQRETSQVAVRVQAIQEKQADMMAKNREILAKVVASQGNLDTLQAIAQGQGLQTSQLISMEQQLMVQGRVQAVQQLQQATLEEVTQMALDEASATINTTTMPAGHLLPLSK